MNERAVKWLPAIVWAGLIEVATSWPNPTLPAGLPEHADKVVHTGMYAVLGFLVARGSGRSGPRSATVNRALVVVAAISCFGALDEWHQQFIPGRAMELGDWMADTTGGFLGFLLFTFMAGVIIARRNPRS